MLGAKTKDQWQGALPQIADRFGTIPQRFESHDVILEPDRDEPEWWAGAPSVVRDGDGVFWLACRMRSAHRPRGERGYELRILRSEDGIHFEKVHTLRREDVPIPGFERPALSIDSRTGRFKLYGCGTWQDGPWCVIKFDDVDRPEQFVPQSAKPVIQPRPKAYDHDAIVTQYKDPVIFEAGGLFHAYTIGTMQETERTYHFTSVDGETWEPAGSPYESILDLAGWHDFYVRPSCVLPVGVGYLFIYEGSNVKWYDPVYNIATGLGFTFDLHTIHDLTPESPLLLSSTPSERFATFRYSHWLHVDGEIWVYAETARPNRSNEIRLFRLPL